MYKAGKGTGERIWNLTWGIATCFLAGVVFSVARTPHLSWLNQYAIGYVSALAFLYGIKMFVEAVC